MAVKLNGNTPNTPQITTGPKYVEPRLVDYDGDLTKQCFFEYHKIGLQYFIRCWLVFRNISTLFR